MSKQISKTIAEKINWLSERMIYSTESIFEENMFQLVQNQDRIQQPQILNEKITQENLGMLKNRTLTLQL